MTDQLARLKGNLLAIADAYAALADRHRDLVRDERVKPGHDRRHREYHDDDTSTVVFGRPDGSSVLADPVAAALPSGPTKERRNGPVVSGSHEAPVPVNVDVVDLLGPANEGSVFVADLSPWREDQAGHLSVATELHFWVRDIADLLGDPEPRPFVPELAAWLHERAGWAWDYYGAVGEMAVKLDGLARLLCALQNPGRARPVEKSAPCPACGAQTLWGDGERVWCEDEVCGRVLTESEYSTWAAAEAHRNLTGGAGVSARAIAIRWNRPIGTVKRWAHQYGWTRSNGAERPVLYLAEQVEKTVALILEREAREREAKAA